MNSETTKQTQNLYTKQKRNFWFSVGLVFLFSFCLVQPVRAEGASLSLWPASETFFVGDTFSVEIKVDTAGTPVNAAQATICFPSDKLEVLDISKENSVFTLWTEEPVVSDSKISFSGGLPHPGFTGAENIITINFKAKEKSTVELTLDEGKVLASDGKGTNILVFIKEAKYSIQEKIAFSKIEPQVLPGQEFPSPQVFSPTHSYSEEWYNNNNPRFQWGLTPEIIGVSFVFDRSPDTLPAPESEGRLESKTYENIEDGVWYFHLRLANEIGWGPPFHYKVQVDTSPPHPFEIIIDNAGDSTNPNPDLYFETNDDTSGIGYYKFKIDEKRFSKLMLAQINPFPLLHLSPGRHPVIVRAADKAGNNVETKTVIGVEPIASPQITLWPEFYISGEEVFYIEGKSLPETEITILLKKEGEEIKRWQASADIQGEWSFSTKELLKSGTYYLSAQAKDSREALSALSESQKIEVSLSGLCLGPFLISLRKLALILLIIIILGIIISGFSILRSRKAKKVLKKEAQEAKETLHRVFDNLREEIGKRIEMFDSQPGFSEKEREVYEELKKTLDASEESIRKEIGDVEKELE